jgi:hypothetical protein
MEAQRRAIFFLLLPRSFSVLSSSGAPPGVVYNEAMLQGLDYVVDQARQHNLRVLLVLTDYFRDDAGGPLQYMKLSGTDLTGLNNEQIKALFYTNAAALGIYMNYIQAVRQHAEKTPCSWRGAEVALLGAADTPLSPLPPVLVCRLSTASTRSTDASTAPTPLCWAGI